MALEVQDTPLLRSAKKASVKEKILDVLKREKIFPRRKAVHIVEEIEEELLMCGAYKDGAHICYEDFVTDGIVSKNPSGVPCKVREATFVMRLTKRSSLATGTRVAIRLEAIYSVKPEAILHKAMEHSWTKFSHEGDTD